MRLTSPKTEFDKAFLRQFLGMLLIAPFSVITTIVDALFIADAMTQSIVIRTIEDRYKALCDDPSAVATPAPSYIDLIRSDRDYMDSPQFEKDRQYWENLYQSAPCSSTLNASKALSRGLLLCPVYM